MRDLFGLPRDPADRTAEDWLWIDMGGILLRWLYVAFMVGMFVGAGAVWLVMH